MRFEPGNGVPRSNMKYELVRDVCIHDLRSSNFEFEQDGLQVVDLES